MPEEDFLRCLRCGLCSYTCPTYRILRSQAQSPRGRIALLRAASRGDLAPGPDLAASIFRCTLCAACSRACPAGLRADDLLLQSRADLAGRQLLPSGLVRLADTLSAAHNLAGDDNALRLIWADGLPQPLRGAGRTMAEIVYFVGCVSSFFPRSYAIPRSTAHILDSAGVDYVLLGDGEWCCGFPLLAAGLETAAIEAVRHNVAQVRATGASQVVTSCPSCYHAWQVEYPRLAGQEMAGLEVWHTSELFDDLIRQGRLRLQPVSGDAVSGDELAVTYHDPCDLGRKSKIIEAPRRVLSSIPGLKVVEMRENREDALCCGGGGNLETVDPGLVQALAARRLAQALQTGAGTIVSACQQCERTLAAAARRERAPIRVLDLAEILCQACER